MFRHSIFISVNLDFWSEMAIRLWCDIVIGLFWNWNSVIKRLRSLWSCRYFQG